MRKSQISLAPLLLYLLTMAPAPKDEDLSYFVPTIMGWDGTKLEHDTVRSRIYKVK
jgi:hypothetical protein